MVKSTEMMKIKLLSKSDGKLANLNKIILLSIYIMDPSLISYSSSKKM